MYRVRIWIDDRIEDQYCQQIEYATMKKKRAEFAGRPCEVMDCEEFKTRMNDEMSSLVTRVSQGLTTQEDADIVIALFHRLSEALPKEERFIENHN